MTDRSHFPFGAYFKWLHSVWALMLAKTGPNVKAIGLDVSFGRIEIR